MFLLSQGNQSVKEALILDPNSLPEEKITAVTPTLKETCGKLLHLFCDIQFWFLAWGKRGWIRFHDKDFIGRLECDECRSVVRNVLRENSDFLLLLWNCFPTVVEWYYPGWQSEFTGLVHAEEFLFTVTFTLFDQENICVWLFYSPKLFFAFKSVCSFQVLHLLAPHSFDTTWLSKVKSSVNVFFFIKLLRFRLFATLQLDFIIFALLQKNCTPSALPGSLFMAFLQVRWSLSQRLAAGMADDHNAQWFSSANIKDSVIGATSVDQRLNDVGTFNNSNHHCELVKC